jgi:hypothetical protein
MTELSPAAQAVLDAYLKSPWDPSLQQEDRYAIAAALRAAADISKRSAADSTPSTDWGDGWKDGLLDTAQGLLAIAAELEQATSINTTEAQ